MASGVFATFCWMLVLFTLFFVFFRLDTVDLTPFLVCT